MATNETVSIYTTPTCHFCHAAKEFFTANGVHYTEYNVAADIEKRKEMIGKSGQMGVPVITVGENLVVGFDEPKLRQLLAIIESADTV
jgi:glutaredoxin 3